MLDVHVPHPTHTWKDFFLHIATIVVGLLIAVGLEQTVEAIHHHRERVETRDSLREEITENRDILALDVKALASEHKMLEANLEVLAKLRSHQHVPPKSLLFGWEWNSMQDSAWQTARETTAIALFPSRQIEGYSMTYGQQALVNEAGNAVIHALTDSSVTLRIQPDLAALTPAQVEDLAHGYASALNQIEFAQVLIHSLDPKYNEVLKTF